MAYRLKKAINGECLKMEDESGRTVYFDKAGFVIPIRDSLRLELQKELKTVIKSEENINHENLIKYIALEKYNGELYLARDDPKIKDIFSLETDGLEDACRVLLQVLEIMLTFHGQGIPLGGLTPGQLRQDADGKFLLQDPLVMNHLHKSLGPLYRIDLTPEVIRGSKWDGRSDIFSWGELAYRLLGGGDPFEAGSPEERVEKIIRNTVIHIKDCEPRLSPRLSQLIMRCLNPSPKERPIGADLAGQLTAMINEGSYRVSDREALKYAGKAGNNIKKYRIIGRFSSWFKKYQAAVYIGLGLLLLLALIFAGRDKGVLTVNTPPRKVVDYYYQGIKTLNPVVTDETLYKVPKQNSLEEMVINLYVLNRGRQYIDRSANESIDVSFPVLKLTPLTLSKLRASYRAEYTLKISASDQTNYIQRTEELTLKPVAKIWRIVNIRIIREKRWTEKAVIPSASQPPGN